MSTRLHGREVVLNFGNLYPITLRTFPTYNAPLIEVVALTSAALGRPLKVVDVGAAAGDSVLLLMQRCPGMVGSFECFEGHDGFFSILEKNLGDHERCRLHHVVLSDSPGTGRSLVQTHRATASMQGSDTVATTTIDHELTDFDVDVLKVDTDGFDGRVLSGASQLLLRSSPTVIFEWHPALCRATGNNELMAFDVLAEVGYRTFVFFTKHGVFSHFIVDVAQSRRELQLLSEYCLTTSTRPDWHYDVVALVDGAELSAVALADLTHASKDGHGHLSE